MNKREILILSFSAMFFLAVSFVAYSWMEPTSMPNTYSIPINTGSIAQSKAGEIAATIFRDTDDPNYFLNPSGLNKLSKLYVEEGVYSQGGSGDVDGDGRLRLLDMILISRYLSGEFKLGSPEFTIDMWREADVNGDGKSRLA